MTTAAIDKELHELIVASGAYPSPLGYKGFPKSTCTSINNVRALTTDRFSCRLADQGWSCLQVIAHGIPDECVFLRAAHTIPSDCSLELTLHSALFLSLSRPLDDHDIINIDVTVFLNGYHGDTSRTFLLPAAVRPFPHAPLEQGIKTDLSST